MMLLRAPCERLAASADAIALADLDGVELNSVAEAHLQRGRRPGRLHLIGPRRPVVVFDGTAEQWETRAYSTCSLTSPAPASSTRTTTAPATPE